ncbi:ankyrin repeat domain-containing protein [Pseudomonas sp. LP_7_YM]|uniref:ankyrin repeat domain-containing protein n=1 Tax=Pseudomonas sp. LP_7_YM TaxID=2485137 RepID=UPI00105EA343|nr:ankyrin repeat domain-containing protein [Pseudomonas sp. LP_7_YM]TDV65859.1 hypothetical protein EC915_104139 [Pseudomonas sp. LP_7_YM]
MTPIRPGTSPFIPPQANEPIHAALASHDSERVLQARKEGQRANALDHSRRSPMDVLDTMRGIDERTRSGLRSALLQSLNPTAPAGYMKPEALHGSPWGLEILTTGALKGGVNDAKGGAQSLNGRVFFSDRTPESASDTTTRENLRTKARSYSRGASSFSSSANSRAQQHRLTQIIESSLDKGLALSLSFRPVTLGIKNPAEIQSEGATWLQAFLHHSIIVKGGARPLLNKPFEESVKALKLPETMTLTFEGSPDRTLRGKELESFYKQSASELRNSLENGKAPYLSLLNQGTVVPMVLGFEKVRNLSSHSVSAPMGNASKQYSYQDNDHPLSGSAEGGRLKELEVRSLADLATLFLGCEVKGTSLADDLLVRVKEAGTKADYLPPAQRNQFREKILAQASRLLPEDAHTALANQPLSTLQQINAKLRSEDLRAYLA